MRGLIALTVLALTAASLGWTTWKSRRALRRGLGRKVRAGEETSLRTWMELPTESLDAVNQELEANPFEAVLDSVGRNRDTNRP